MQWIEFKNTYSEIESFQPGVLLKTYSGEILLYGNLNLDLGSCGCCDMGSEIEFYSKDFVPIYQDFLKNLMH